MGVALLALIVLSAALGGQRQPGADEAGLSGLVVAPDGTPVSSGTAMIVFANVFMPSQGVRAAAAIDHMGRFRVVPNTPGLHQLVVSVSGFAAYRVNVTIPPSRKMQLPVIQLSPVTYFRARFVTPDGEPIASPQLRRQSLDLNGRPVSEPPDARTAGQIEDDGTITIGPLPRGVTTLAVDAPLLAQMRLPDVLVTGAEPLLDGGTVTVQPGAVLNVDLVDASGAPVPKHDVYLEDAVALSPLTYRPARTNQQGRASFERLGAGRYRVRTKAIGFCNGVRDLWVARVLVVSGNGALRTRLVIEGAATLRLASPYGPMRGASVFVSPDVTPTARPKWLRARSELGPSVGGPFAPRGQGSCGGFTDAEGRITLTNFPPGPARVDVRLLNSTYVRRVEVPQDGKEIAIVIPDGYLPLRVTNALKNGPIAGATITWTGGGRVEARTTGNGEALLEGVSGGGTLAIAADGFEPGEEKLPEPPGMLYEVALRPSPPPVLPVQAVNPSGEPVRDAVVELSPADPLELGHVAATDAKGSVTFSSVPAGALRVVVTADGYLPATMDIRNDQRTLVVLKLSRREFQISPLPSATRLRADRAARHH